MRRLLAFLAPLVLACRVVAAQATPSHPIPEARQFAHTGQIDRSYEDEEKSTSVVLAMTLDASELESFAGKDSRIRSVRLDAGFVHTGWVMTGYPDVVTLVLKLVEPQRRTHLTSPPLASIAFSVDGRPEMKMPAALVNRASVRDDGKERRIEDTYVVVMPLNQFLELVNGSGVTATLEKHRLTFTGAPLEGMRDLASRMTVVR